jgi:hypothetical protein
VKSKLLLITALAACGALPGWGAATIIINNVNAAGVGFNDPTPAAPVGGNPGTTLGQQRLIAFQRAAEIWAATLTSSVTIHIDAQFTALSCTATAAVLGSAGPKTIHADFTGAPVANRWYPQALANKLAGTDLAVGTADISANFNVNLGQPGCFTGTFFYLGLDRNAGSSVDLVATVLHEFAHGLGFLTVTNGATGAFLAGRPSIFDEFLYDNSLGRTWVNMTAAERATSAVSVNHLTWSGPLVTSVVPSVLIPPPSVTVKPVTGGTIKITTVGVAGFGAPLTTTGTSAELMPVVDQPDGRGLACTPLNSVNALAVAGKIALIDRGTCSFAVKVKNAQDAGAVGVILANNAAGVVTPTGSDPAITVPTMLVSLADGAVLKSMLLARSRTRSGVTATLALDTSLGLAGADPAGRPLMFAPNPFQSGSSVSHWDQSLLPNQLMEPNINSDLLHSPDLPRDLTLRLLRDLGW